LHLERNFLYRSDQDKNMSTHEPTTNVMPEAYDFRSIEARWQQVWEEQRTFAAADDDPRQKLYVLQMFPYPSGDLHAGHIRNYVIGDSVARYWRMQGYNVMHPMGRQPTAGGQAAIDRQINPQD
jgi:leucyl-tRNA synthetase